MNRLVYTRVPAVRSDCSSLLCWMVGTRVSLRALTFAEISDLLHEEGGAPSPVHHRPHPRKESHLGPHQPTGSRHDHHLCFITPDALDDCPGYCLGGGHKRFPHFRPVGTRFLHRSHGSTGSAATAPAEHGATHTSHALVRPHHPAETKC